MSFLSRFRVLTKILAVIALLSVITVGITALGVTSLKHLDEAAQRMELVSEEALLGQRLSVNLLSMNRAEFQLVADPRPENRAAMREAVTAETKQFGERLQALAGKIKRADLKAQVAEIEQAWSVYQRDLAETFRAAEAVTTFQSTKELDVLRKDALASAEVGAKLRTSLRTLSDGLEKELHKVAHDADEEYRSVSLWMEVSAGIGIVLGLLLGFLVAQFGIAKPMRALVALLQRLARGEEVEIVGTERGDEVGETARAVNGIKDMLAEKARVEAQEKAAADARAVASRKADMHKIADEFQAAVGNIVDTVSSASTELEAVPSRDWLELRVA